MATGASQEPSGKSRLNACKLGQARSIANFVAGWAPAVLDTGASGYIGGMWPLVDRAAAEFSARFYREVERGMKRGPVSVFAALREARRLFYHTGDPTFPDHAYFRDVNLRFRHL